MRKDEKIREAAMALVGFAVGPLITNPAEYLVTTQHINALRSALALPEDEGVPVAYLLLDSVGKTVDVFPSKSEADRHARKLGAERHPTWTPDGNGGLVRLNAPPFRAVPLYDRPTVAAEDEGVEAARPAPSAESVREAVIDEDAVQAALGTIDKPTTAEERTEKDRPAYPSLYCAVWPSLVPVARALGYALMVHGSLSRDLDLVAVPWTENAVNHETLIEAIRRKFGAWVGDAVSHPRDGRKPHGRLGAIIVLGGHAVVDLSIMPRSLPLPPASKVERARERFHDEARAYFDGQTKGTVACADYGFKMLRNAQEAHKALLAAEDEARNNKGGSDA